MRKSSQKQYINTNRSQGHDSTQNIEKNHQRDHQKKENTQRYRQDDAREDGCMSSLVPTPRSHWNCNQIFKFHIITTLHHSNKNFLQGAETKMKTPLTPKSRCYKRPIETKDPQKARLITVPFQL